MQRQIVTVDRLCVAKRRGFDAASPGAAVRV
jgi:hypothetical protein